MSRLFAFLGIQRGEGRSAGLMVGHSFFMGTSTVFFETAASALFLSQFERQTLPWVYVAAAALNIVTGAVYSWLRERASFSRLMAGTLLFLLLSVGAFRVGLALGAAAWLVFALLVWYRVLSILTDLEYWAVAARLYDVRQAKRLFGLIGTGEVVARIVGAFSVPLFVQRVGVPNLLWLSAAGLSMCLLLLLPVLRLVPGAETPAPRAARGERGALQQMRAVGGDSYLRVVTAIAVMAVFGKYFVDFAFLEQMSARYSDVKNLAGFFGIFSGLTQGLSLLTRLLVSRPLLERFGIRTGLLVLPLVQLLCTLLIVANGALGDSDSALVFWLVIANQGVYKTLKHPIDNPAFKVLYQPLRAEQRLAAQISVEVIFTPLTIGIAGGIMLLMSTLIRYDPVRFAYVLLANFALWTLVARRGSRAYQGALHEVLRRRIVDDAPFTLNDATSVALLRSKLVGGTPAEVIFALHLLERAEYAGTASALLERLDHPAPEVRRYALERLAALRPAGALDVVRRRVTIEPDARALSAAVRALGTLGGDASAPTLLSFLSHADASVRRGALAALFGLAGPDARAPALGRLRKLVASPDAGDRLLAARALGDRCPVEAHEPLGQLLHDADSAVRRAAFTAAARRPELAPLLVENLGQAGYAGAAAAALVAAGEAVVPTLIESFIGGGRRALLVRLVRVLGEIGSARGQAFLRAQLGYPDQAVRGEAMDALRRAGYQAAGAAEQATLDALLFEEAEQAAQTLAAWRDLPADGAWRPLNQALEAELRRTRRRVFALLSFRYDREVILRARDNVGHASRDKRAYALEVLDLTLGARHKALLMPLLDDRAADARLGALEARFPQARRTAAQRVAELLARPERSLSAWTRACALRAAAAAGLVELRDTIERLRPVEPLLRETAAAALQALDRGAPNPDGRSPMLLIEKVMILKGVQIFEHTSEEILTEIAAVVEEVEASDGTVIFNKGDAGDSMYVIVEGQVRVKDGERTINVLGEREIFGELALLDPEPRSASCLAVGDCRLFRLDAETFSQLMAANIEIVRGVLHVLCERLRRVTAGPRPER